MKKNITIEIDTDLSENQICIAEECSSGATYSLEQALPLLDSISNAFNDYLLCFADLDKE